MVAPIPWTPAGHDPCVDTDVGCVSEGPVDAVRLRKVLGEMTPVTDERPPHHDLGQSLTVDELRGMYHVAADRADQAEQKITAIRKLAEAFELGIYCNTIGGRILAVLDQNEARDGDMG